MDNQSNNNQVDTESYDDNEINFSEVKNNFLKAFDENKEKIKQITPIFQKMDEIFKMAKEINGDIKNLEQATQVILEKQHRDYINTFISFMDSIRKELTQKLEDMEKLAEEKRKANDIRIIKCERDFFRLEAVRLNGICKSFKEKIDELTFNNKLLADELNSLKFKWKESENINKQLLFELESNIQSHKDLEQKLNMTRGLLNSQKFNPNLSVVNQNSQNLENLNEEEIKKLQDINSLEEQLRRSKTELKREKERANKALVSLNKIYLERNKYESIFQNCVEETKKIIFNRRVKENKGFKIKNRTGIGKYDCKVNLSTKYEDFLPTDKMNTLENFIFNEEVFNLVKEAIFSKPKKKGNNIENSKNLVGSFKFLNPDWKMKEIIENANENGDSVMPMMPLINQGRSSSVSEKPKSLYSNKGGGGSQFYRTGRMSLNKKNAGFGSTAKLSMDMYIS
jgi:hypothetical protein